MALFDEVKTSLRVSIDDADINQQIQTLIDAAKEDLVNTADISSNVVFADEVPALVKLALTTFVKAHWTESEAEQERLLKVYNGLKGRLSISSAYSTYDEVSDG